ncbi:MAG: transglutaminase domain-containing protein [Armatimonadetes bacterium]|nr:transglutaminase domain-containing protein [Armatimonadota bacterium]
MRRRTREQKRQAAEARRREMAETRAAWRRDVGPADPVMYVATAVAVIAPVLAGWSVLAVEPMMLVVVLVLSVIGLPISLALRRRGANQRRLNGWVTLAAVAAGGLMAALAVNHGTLSLDRLMSGESIFVAWLIRFIAWVVAFRAMTLLTDFDLQLCIGFGLSQFVLLGIIASDAAVVTALLPFIGASLLLRLRVRRRQQLAAANQVAGRTELGDWRQDTALLARLGAVMGLLAVVFSVSLSGLHLHSTFVQTIGAPLAMRLSQWIGQYSASRLAEGAEPCLEVGDVGGSNNEVPVFRVQGPAGLLWRGSVYGEYDGRRFKPTGEKALHNLQALGDGVIQVKPDAPADTAHLQRFRFDRLMDIGTLIYTVRGTSHVQTGTSRLIVNTAGTVCAVPGLGPGTSYTVWAPGKDAEGTRHVLKPADRDRYLQTSRTTSLRVGMLARQITQGCTTYEEKIAALMTWFGDHKTYTLRPQPVPRNVDAVEYFLLVMQSGWCRHFASSFAVLARSVAVPTRVVSGYSSGEQQPDGSWLVKVKDAHAWVECWLPGRGWVEFDPTGMAVEELTGLALVMDRARSAWRNTVARLPLGKALAIGLTLMGLLGIALYLRYRARQVKARPHVARRRLNRAERRGERLLASMVRAARRAGVTRDPADTELALAQRWAEARPWLARDIRRLADLVARGRFSPQPLTEAELAQARELLSGIRRRRRPPAPVLAPATGD